MPFDETLQETDSLSELSSMPQDSQQEMPMDASGGIPGLGGPGVDTPQEQEAVKNLMEAAKLFRVAAQSDPSIKPIIDTFLQDAFLKITDHYGFGEEGKMALKQAQMAQSKARSAALTYGKPPTQGPPVGSGPSGPPPSFSPPSNVSLEY
jgi:hypothetical protein